MLKTIKKKIETGKARKAADEAAKKLWIEGKSGGYFSMASGSGSGGEKARQARASTAQNRVSRGEAAAALKGKVRKSPASEGSLGAALDKKRLEEPAKKRGETLDPIYRGMWRREEARKAAKTLKVPLAKKGK